MLFDTPLRDITAEDILDLEGAYPQLRWIRNSNLVCLSITN